jgi:hypothetical protein
MAVRNLAQDLRTLSNTLTTFPQCGYPA